MLSSKADHVFHVWINSESGLCKDKPTLQPIDPHKNGLYDFKSAMQLLQCLPTMIEKDRKQE